MHIELTKQDQEDLAAILNGTSTNINKVFQDVQKEKTKVDRLVGIVSNPEKKKGKKKGKKEK